MHAYEVTERRARLSVIPLDYVPGSAKVFKVYLQTIVELTSW